MFLTLIVSIGIFVFQVFVSKKMDPSLFFTVGGLLLIGLLLLFQVVYYQTRKRKKE